MLSWGFFFSELFFTQDKHLKVKSSMVILSIASILRTPLFISSQMGWILWWIWEKQMQAEWKVSSLYLEEEEDDYDYCQTTQSKDKEAQI